MHFSLFQAKSLFFMPKIVFDVKFVFKTNFEYLGETCEAEFLQLFDRLRVCFEGVGFEETMDIFFELFGTYVEFESDEQCDRLYELAIARSSL